MIDTLNELLIQPGVKKAMEFPFVSNQMERFKLFLGAFYLNFLNKWTSKLRKFLSLKTLILLNLIIISYYAGKANAASISGWVDVITDIHIWFGSTIILNILYLIGRFLRNILIITIQIAIGVIIIWAIYRLFQWIYCKIFGNSDTVLSTIEK